MQQSKSQFHFDQVGKQMPYRVPDGYWDSSIKRVQHQITKVEHRQLWKYMGVACVGACVLVGTLCLMFSPWVKSPNAHFGPRIVSTSGCANATIYSVESDQDNWSDFAEADIFLENMDW